VEACHQYFYPQLILFLLRFLDIYDQSMQGNTVKEYLKMEHNPKSPQQKATDQREKLVKSMGQEILRSFGTTDFWMARYSSLTPNSPTYDWYITWNDLKSTLYKYVHILELFRRKWSAGESPASPSVLHLGCGNSSLSEDMYDEGITQVVGIDFCKDVTDIMLSRRDRLNKSTLSYEHMDVRGLRFDNDLFDVVLDKGCIDCMVCVPAGLDSSKEYIRLCLSEVARVLKVGGYYVLVSCGITPEGFVSFQVEKFGWKVVYGDRIDGKEGLNFSLNLIVVRKEG